MAKNRFKTILPIMLLLVFIITAFGPMMSAGQDGIGFMVGTVYDRDEKFPIAGAAVFLGNNESVWYTNDEGMFAIPDLEYGDYNLTVYAKGYNLTTISVNHRSNGTQVNVPMGREIITPSTTGFITGRVFLEAEIHGHDAGDAVVYVTGAVGAAFSRMLDVHVSDDPLIGSYVVELPPGDYDLSAWAYSHHVRHSGTVSLSAGSVEHVDFHLELVDMHNSGLAGNVTDSDSGDPIVDAVVVAYNVDEALYYFTRSDTDGFYFFTGPWEGSYLIGVVAAGYDPGSGTGIVNWGAATYVDISLHLNQTSTNCSVLWGFVYGDGFPRADGFVFTDYGLSTGTNFIGIPGMYYIPCFPSGSPHGVGAWAPGFYPVVNSVTVPSGSVVRHDFYLQGIGNITSKWSLLVGNVFLEGTTTPLDNVDVHLDGPSFSQNYPCGPTSNFFWFAMVPPGSGYHFNPVRSGFTYVGFSIGSGPETPASTDFTVPSHTLVMADIFMERGEPNNRTMIWGYVYDGSLSGPVVPSVPVKLLLPTGVAPILTTATGYYSFSVSPGLHSVTIFVIGYSSIHYFDYLTGTNGPAPWMDTVAMGTSRHVDFVIKRGEPVQNCSLVAGQVIDISTGNPVDNYEVKTYPMSGVPLVTQSGSLLPGTGLFMFNPICCCIPGTWYIDGFDTTFTYDFEYLDYHSIPGGASTTSSVMFTSYMLPTDTILWFNIYVNKTQVEKNTTIWGYLYMYSVGGPVVTGETIKVISPPGTMEMDTDGFGMYIFHVSPGTFTIAPILIYPVSAVSYDHLTSTYGMIPWTGTVALGDSRHVDFVLKQYPPTRNASAISGIVMELDDHTPVPGFYVKAYPQLHPGDYPSLYTYTDGMGMFHFGPLYLDLDESWLFSGEDPLYEIDHVEYHLLPSGPVTTETSLPLFFDLPGASIMWVEIYVNERQVCNSTVFGKVYKLYSYDPASGAQASIFDTSDPSVEVDTQTLGSDGLYTFTVPEGSYIVKVSLSGYMTETATVTVVCGEETYHPFYLLPFVIGPWDDVHMKFVMNDTGEPLSGYDVDISGMGHFKTDENGIISFRIPGRSNLTISLKSFVVVISTDDDDEELSVNDDGSFTIEPGMNYTMKVVKFRPGSELSNTVKSAEGTSISTPGLIGIAALALLVGAAGGYFLKRRSDDMGEE